MSILKTLLDMLNPINSAKASTLTEGMPDYNIEKAQQAAADLKKGASLDEVWQKYGYYPWKNKSGQEVMLGEIPDTTSELKLPKDLDKFFERAKPGTLGGAYTQLELAPEILDHPLLYKNAPYLKDTLVNAVIYGPKDSASLKLPADSKEKITGDYSRYGVTYNSRPDSAVDIYAPQAEAKSTLLHELNHVIQDRANLGTYYEPKQTKDEREMTKYRTSDLELLSRTAEVRSKYSDEQLQEESPLTTLNAIKQFYLGNTGLPKSYKPKMRAKGPRKLALGPRKSLLESLLYSYSGD